MKRDIIRIALFAVGGFTLLNNTILACFAPTLSGGGTLGVDNVHFQVDSSASTMVAGGSSAIVGGFNHWNSAPCAVSTFPRPFPFFLTSTGTDTIHVVGVDDFATDHGATADSCASFTLNQNILRLYTNTRDSSGNEYTCNWSDPVNVGKIVAHEVGHYLGLNDSNCDGTIMGLPTDVIYANGEATYLMAGNDISSNECERAAEMSYTQTEIYYEDAQCQSDPSCDPYAPCYADPGGCSCPILIDLDRNQFHLAGEVGAVSFDIDADGDAETITWTRGDHMDAFLCWDRNGNGFIDDGSELFGNSTPLNNGGISPFGYIALLELDQADAGGNHDGIIDEDDTVFTQLCVWLDSNQDGSSDSGEIQSLTEAGVLSIEVDYRTYPRRDQFGNLFLYTGEARIFRDGKIRRTSTTDVFFVEID